MRQAASAQEQTTVTIAEIAQSNGFSTDTNHTVGEVLGVIRYGVSRRDEGKLSRLSRSLMLNHVLLENYGSNLLVGSRLRHSLVLTPTYHTQSMRGPGV